MKYKDFSPEKKNRIKIVRSVFEGIIIITVLILIIKTLFTFSVYEPYVSKETKNVKNGFIAVSYFGVDRTGNETLISNNALKNQIKALKDNGYVTITQEDILDYYKSGKALPAKALFLLFEDGRRDTAIFSQEILEQCNYKATMLTYADKFEKKDPKFLMPKDLLNLKESSFWELGTNGYRLEYINVFDRNNNFLGRLNSVEFSKVAPKIRREYNHYLMDYIRDENGIPMETHEEMNKRMDYDYETLAKIYNNEIGYVPQLYVIMHSNTGKFGTNNNSSEVNGKWIKELFSINFNREGYSLNQSNSSIYDLTRIQPQAYWSTNHLLMRIWDDTKQDTEFVIGNKEKAKDFNQICGQTEFVDDKIILTSLPSEKGLIKLANINDLKNVKISTILKGNILGSQSIYLRSNEDTSNSICIQIVNNIANIIENSNGNKSNLYSLDLGDKTKEYDIKDSGSKKIDISLIDNKLTLTVDDKKVTEDLEVNNQSKGAIFLEAAWGKYEYSQRNIADDVYDGIFQSFKVMDVNNELLYDSSLKGVEAVSYKVKSSFDKLINWFIKNL